MSNQELIALAEKCKVIAIESGAYESYGACRDAFDELLAALTREQEAPPAELPRGELTEKQWKAAAQPAAQEPILREFVAWIGSENGAAMMATIAGRGEILKRAEAIASQPPSAQEPSKPRPEFLALAETHGAILTGKPDGSEAITVVFTIDAWRAFDAALAAQPAPDAPVDTIKHLPLFMRGYAAGMKDAKASYEAHYDRAAQPAATVLSTLKESDKWLDTSVGGMAGVPGY